MAQNQFFHSSFDPKSVFPLRLLHIHPSCDWLKSVIIIQDVHLAIIKNAYLAIFKTLHNLV
jgi:hypothetical protein